MYQSEKDKGGFGMPSYQTTAARRTRRRAGRYQKSVLTRFCRGMLAAVGVTIGAILLFALLMQWLKPADMVIRVVNQLVKLAAILVGVWVFVGKGGENALTRGALLGLAYMGIGVCLYALLSGQQLPISAYLADLAMGVAGGGISGGVLGNLRR